MKKFLSALSAYLIGGLLGWFVIGPLGVVYILDPLISYYKGEYDRRGVPTFEEYNTPLNFNYNKLESMNFNVEL
jgi:hypothetical protein